MSLLKDEVIELIQNTGYCHCCREETTFTIHNDWLRDHYLCGKCNSIPRQRGINHILDRYFSGWENLSIHESSPSNDFISRYCSDYSRSYYIPENPLGETINGLRCENLEAMTFSDNSFDIFITQDVLEHVFNPDKAVKEIMRVLKPGGAHIFTAPKHKLTKESYRRAEIKNSDIVYLMEAEYHGNPIGDNRSLVTWDYGDDFEFLLHKWCGHPTTNYVTRDRSLGIDGEYLDVFVTRKSINK